MITDLDIININFTEINRINNKLLAENNFTTLLGAKAFERCYPPQILNGSLTSPIQIALGSFLLLNKDATLWFSSRNT